MKQSETVKRIHRRATRIEIIAGITLATIIALLAALPTVDWPLLAHLGQEWLAAHPADTAAATDTTMPLVAVLLGAALVAAVIASNRRADR